MRSVGLEIPSSSSRDLLRDGDGDGQKVVQEGDDERHLVLDRRSPKKTAQSRSREMTTKKVRTVDCSVRMRGMSSTTSESGGGERVLGGGVIAGAMM